MVPDAYLDAMDVAERAGDAVGFVAFGPCREADAGQSTAELYAVYVLADRWRRGIGTALRDVCLAELAIVRYRRAL